MATPLKRFRESYLDTLLRFLWREWTALGVAGHERAALRHVADPEALLLLTCSVGRYDQRLFDEVMDWLTTNGRFLNVQRLRNILRKEKFSGGHVLSAVGDWLARQDDPLKWKRLARTETYRGKPRALFHRRDGMPLPDSSNSDPVFLEHGYIRNPPALRAYSGSFDPHAVPCLLLRLRALLGVNARCDILIYLLLNGSGHPREVARELYYSQKAIHDAMVDMACSGVVTSSRARRERVFRIAYGNWPCFTGEAEVPRWRNWPVVLRAAEIVWEKTDELAAANLDPLLEASEIALTMQPLFDRLVRALWAPAIPATRPASGASQMEAFQTMFKDVTA